MAKKLMKGCEAIGEAAIQSGCRLFFGYPITPQNEIPEYLSARLPQVGGAFVQAESEVAAVNMLYGAAGAGCRCFSSSSSPGISLMMEGMSYLAGAELPVVIVNIMRAGPGLGGILPSQSDYLQATKGGGHGDYRVLVLAPSTVQEAADLTMEAFDLADKYRNPVMILGDGLIGQMMEPVEFKRRIEPEELPEKLWATTGAVGRAPNIVNSLYLRAEDLEQHNIALAGKYRAMAAETRHETYRADDALDVLIVAYGTVARIARTSIDALREKGLKAGLFRPVTLFPYPTAALAAAATRAKHVLVAELSMGQMVEDVRAAVAGRVPVDFYGRAGGMVMSAEELAEQVEKLAAVPA
jgi:2-oxoglutarate/2-oxoacid ferredoxin oxidoreductase subunit alpha